MTLEIIAASAGTTATAWLWEQYGKDMVGGMWSRLTGKFGQEWAEFKEADRWETAREAYRESLYRDHHKIRVLGHSEPVTLEEIYTDVYILDKVAARQRYDIQELLENPPERGLDYLHEPKRFNGLELVRQGEHPRLFILGKPGAGKTTFLRYLTLQAVRGKLNKVPLFINLKRWSTDDIPLMAYLEREFDMCSFPQAEPFIQTLLETGRALVMFDGLDEVNKEGGLRQKINQKIDDFCRQYHKNQFLITCRIAATDHAFRHFQDVELADFTEGQIRRFVRKWFSKQPEKRQVFETQFFAEENEPVRELGNIPILLTLLCLAFDDSMSFPRRRVELYEDAIDALLRKWDSSRTIKRDEIYKGLSVRLKQRMFAHIADQTFEQGELFFEERKLVRLIEQFIEKLPDADKQTEPDGYVILKAIEAQHSIFVERAKGIYSFSHLTFQEYFTAKYIADNERRGTVERLMVHVSDPRWREVFLLSVSLLDEADEFFELLQTAVDKVVLENQSLIELLAWVNDQTNQAPSSVTDLRVGYLGINHALYRPLDLYPHALYHALSLDRDLYLTLILTSDLYRALDLARDIALDRALDIALARDLDRYLDRDIDLALDIALDLEQKFGLGLALDMALTYLWQMARIFRYGVENEKIGQYLPDYKNYFQQVISMSQRLPTSSLVEGLGRLSDPMLQTKEGWQSFVDELKELMQTERNLFPDITLDRGDYEQLEQYLEATKLLQDCLTLAVVSDRAGIEGQILRVPK